MWMDRLRLVERKARYESCSCPTSTSGRNCGQRSTTPWWSWGLPWQSHCRSRVMHRSGRCRKQQSSYLLRERWGQAWPLPCPMLPLPHSHTHLEAVRTLTSRSPLKTNCPGFQWKERPLHSQCMFSVVL